MKVMDEQLRGYSEGEIFFKWRESGRLFRKQGISPFALKSGWDPDLQIASI